MDAIDPDAEKTSEVIDDAAKKIDEAGSDGGGSDGDKQVCNSTFLYPHSLSNADYSEHQQW